MDMFGIIEDYLTMNELFELIEPLEIKNPSTEKFPEIKRVLFNNPATIIFWEDGTKTVVKCHEDDEYDKEKGFAIAICKKLLGNNGDYYELFKKYL